MPNGHGGTPRFGAPLALALATGGLVWWRLATGAALPFMLALVVGAWLAQSLAWHLTMWRAMEYGGAYTSAEEFKKANRRCIAVTAVMGVVILGGLYWLMSR